MIKIYTMIKEHRNKDIDRRLKEVLKIENESVFLNKSRFIKNKFSLEYPMHFFKNKICFTTIFY